MTREEIIEQINKNKPCPLIGMIDDCGKSCWECLYSSIYDTLIAPLVAERDKLLSGNREYANMNKEASEEIAALDAGCVQCREKQRDSKRKYAELKAENERLKEELEAEHRALELAINEFWTNDNDEIHRMADLFRQQKVLTTIRGTLYPRQRQAAAHTCYGKCARCYRTEQCGRFLGVVLQAGETRLHEQI